jgi:uncharacterized membrane protein YeaQ/YmgE (transglycosylase-associated protein family)
MIYVLLIGLAAGAIAGRVMRGKGFGFVLNLIIGVAGAYFGSWLFAEMGIHIRGGIIGTLFVAVTGAVILLFVLNLLKKMMDR